MLTTSAAAALVGAAGAPVAGPTKHVRVERAFYHGGVPHPVGAVLEVPASFAAELVSARKAVIVEKPAPVAEPAVEPPVEPEPAPRGKRRAKE